MHCFFTSGDGAILCQFDTSRKKNSNFDGDIHQAITETRWSEIKQVMKPCNNAQHPKRGMQGLALIWHANIGSSTMCFGQQHQQKGKCHFGCLWRCNNVATQLIWRHQEWSNRQHCCKMASPELRKGVKLSWSQTEINSGHGLS